MEILGACLHWVTLVHFSEFCFPLSLNPSSVCWSAAACGILSSVDCTGFGCIVADFRMVFSRSKLLLHGCCYILSSVQLVFGHCCFYGARTMHTLQARRGNRRWQQVGIDSNTPPAICVTSTTLLWDQLKQQKGMLPNCFYNIAVGWLVPTKLLDKHWYLHTETALLVTSN